MIQIPERWCDSAARKRDEGIVICGMVRPMKILIADDDVVLRKVLHSLLLKSKHEVMLAENGDAAWELIRNPPAPRVVILDWMMPGLSGPEVCDKLRKSNLKSRPYVILLSARREKEDIVSGLEAGADDYLTKPFHPAELQARLRVAERILNYERDLQQQISDMELLLRRHNLLGEIFGKRRLGGNASPQVAASASLSAAADSATSFNHRVAILLPASEVSRLLLKGLTALGVEGASPLDMATAPKAPRPTLTAWSPLVFINDGIWVDLKIEVDRAASRVLFQSMVKRAPVSDDEVLDMLAEALNLMQNTIRGEFENQEIEVFTPLLPRAVRTEALDNLPASTRVPVPHLFATADMLIQFSLQIQPAVAVQKEVGNLNALDMLAESISSPYIAGVVLLNKGVMLNLRYIHKLTELAQQGSKGPPVSVLEPSRLTRFFCAG